MPTPEEVVRDDAAKGSTEGETPDPKETSPPVVPRDEELERLKVENASYKKDMFKYKDERNTLREQKSEAEKTLLKGQDDQTAYVKNLEDENKALLEKDRVRNDAFVTSKKIDAVREAAMQAGIENVDDIELLPMDSVTVEITDSGRVIVSGAKEFVEGIKTSRPRWFKRTRTPAFNPGGGGDTTPTAEVLTAHFMNELETKDPVKYKRLMPEYQRQLKLKRAQ